ncbi:hypothetical protein FXO37_19202 [Capsicum annuum]|nr:hypothetical protein FXO37_19202 [Capsicum annuum]
MLFEAYLLVVQSQLELALGRCENTLTTIERAGQIDPRSVEVSVLLKNWEKSVDDCNQALCIQPNYTEALLRKAASNAKLERWVEAVIDYEVLRKALPYDNKVANSFSHSQVALKKSRGEDIYNFVLIGGGRLYTNLLYLLKVDMEESPAVASAENVRFLPTFKIYKQGNFLKEAVSPNPEELESLVRHYTSYEHDCYVICFFIYFPSLLSPP